MIITIDGPTASGKSTVARMLAQKLGYYYIYSGLLFRGLAYILMRDMHYAPDQLNNPRMHDVAKVLDPEQFVYVFDVVRGEQLFYAGDDITPFLKESSVDIGASVIGTHKLVRDYLVTLQRAIADTHDAVIDGRDAGSIVFPHANVKFFLTAEVHERARRWKIVQDHYGKHVSLPNAVALITQRDARDQERVYAPLHVPLGAIVIDSTSLTPEQTIEIIMGHIRNKTGRAQ